MVLDNSVMLRTANRDMYQELVETKRFFKRQIDLLTTALIIGIVNEHASEKRQNHDIIRVGQLTGNLDPFKKMLDLISDIICLNEDSSDCSKLIFSYADGGLELIWADYQAQGDLDLPRLYDDVKKKWEKILPDLIKKIKREDV
jgi:hypothetical protein